ncbi:MAG TPA: hypothetical protein V6D08_12925 [Candidatus Obscuribacterales bacterium]
MASRDTKISPGDIWLSLPPETRLVYLEGLVNGLNQGIRYCANEAAFSLATRLADKLTPANKLAVDSLIQQMRTWAKSGVTVFRYSRPLEDYARSLTEFYKTYPKYSHLSPAYLLCYMDDQHGMEPADLYNLHEHSLHGFKL